VFEGETVGFSQQIKNGKILPMSYLNLLYKEEIAIKQMDEDDAVAYSGLYRSTLFILPAKKQVTHKSRLLCTKRGYYIIDKAIAQSSDLLFSKFYQKEIDLLATITVYPKEIEVDSVDIPFKRLTGDILAKRFILPDPFEFTGIREYQPFDSFRQINFNAWAKTGEPMSNIYGHTVSQEIRIVLNLQSYSAHTSGRERSLVFENAIRLAAFFARKYLELGIPVSFSTNGLDVITGIPGRAQKGQTTRHLQEIYEILARIDLDKCLRCEPIDEFLPDLPEMRTQGVVVTLISTLANEEINSWYKDAVDNGADVLWVAPVYPADRSPYEDGVVRWEVPND